MKNIKV